MRATPAVIIGALVCAAAGGYLATRLYQGARTGPFELWTLRAGMPFSTIDDREHDATKRRFVCTPLEGTGRFCQLHGREMTGMLRLFVDAKGRAAVIQFWPADDNLRVGDEARRLAAEWSRIRLPMSARPDNGPPWATTSRWRTTDRQWSATIQYSCLATGPTVIEVADDAALAAAIERNPNAASQLAGANLIAPAEEAELSDAPRRAPGECGTPKFARPST
jgi:hypothetical protein